MRVSLLRAGIDGCRARGLEYDGVHGAGNMLAWRDAHPDETPPAHRALMARSVRQQDRMMMQKPAPGKSRPLVP